MDLDAQRAAAWRGLAALSSASAAERAAVRGSLGAVTAQEHTEEASGDTAWALVKGLFADVEKERERGPDGDQASPAASVKPGTSRVSSAARDALKEWQAGAAQREQQRAGFPAARRKNARDNDAKTTARLTEVAAREAAEAQEDVNARKADWDESAHPRGEGGRFGAGTDLHGDARSKVEDAVWSMYQKSYAAIGMHLAGKADMREYDHWHVFGDPPHAFVASKTTPYGTKLGVLGSDGSKEGKAAVKDWLKTAFHREGTYGEVSHGVEHLALSGGAPAVPASEVGAILGKAVEPSADGLHYSRNIGGVGRVEKLMVGRPKGVAVVTKGVAVVTKADEDRAARLEAAEHASQLLFDDEPEPSRLEKALGDAAWALLKSQITSGAYDPAVDNTGDRLLKAMSNASQSLLGGYFPVLKDFDESSVTRDEHGKFVKSAEKVAAAAAAAGHVVAGKVVSAKLYAALQDKIAAISHLPPEEYNKQRFALEKKTAQVQVGKDWHARAPGKTFLKKGAGVYTPAHEAHDVAMVAALKASDNAGRLSEEAASSKLPEDYAAAAAAHEAARLAYVQAIKTDSDIKGGHAMASVDDLVAAANAHNEARDRAEKAAAAAAGKAAVAAEAAKPPPSNPLEDPKATCSWAANGTVSVNDVPVVSGAVLNGVPLTHEDPGFWNHTKDVEVGEGPLPTGTKVSSGCIIMEPDGRMWVVEPKDHYDGTLHTFPKGKMDAGEGLTAQQNALKEVYEESGLRVRVVGLMGDYKGASGTTRYYIAQRVGGDPLDAMKAPPGGIVETQAVKLVSQERAAAPSMLNKTRDMKILADLGPKLAKHPELLDRKYAPPVKSVATTVLGTRTGKAQGSNSLGSSGFWKGTDGVDRYVKEYADPAQAHAEHLANNIYNDLGVKAPESMVFEHQGKTLYASKILEGGKQLGLSPSKSDAVAVARGFAADVLTANWDAVGQSGDNILKLPDGGVARIDNGGSLIFRAQGGKKSDEQIHNLSELKGLFDKGTNGSYARVMEAAGVTSAADIPQFKQQVDRITKLASQPGGWAKYVSDRVPELTGKDRDRVVSMLDARSRLLKEASDAYEASKPKVVAPPERPVSLRGAFDGGHHDPATKALAKLVSDSAHHGFGKGPQKAAVDAADAAAGLSSSDRNRIKSLISSWTFGGHDSETQKHTYAAFAEVSAKGMPRRVPSSEVKQAVSSSLATRAERWAAILKHVGVKDAVAPTHFHIARGMGSALDAAIDVAKAWKDESATTVTIKKHAELASWSLGEEHSKQSFTGSNSVLLRWKCPIENTVFDQVVDDASFTSSYEHEHEIIAGPGHNNGLILPKEDHDVIYKGNTYKFADRQKLFDAMKAGGIKL